MSMRSAQAQRIAPDETLLCRKQSLILLALKTVLSLPILVLAMVSVHEGAHLASAAIMGVPIASFTWFDAHYLAPVLVSGPTENALGLTITGYSGGLVAGILLLAILLLKREWFKHSQYRWLLGCYMATLGLWEIYQGILEGAFHDMYILHASGVFSLTYCIGYAAALSGIALYCVSMPRPMKSKAERREGLPQQKYPPCEYIRRLARTRPSRHNISIRE